MSQEIFAGWIFTKVIGHKQVYFIVFTQFEGTNRQHTGHSVKTKML